MDAELLGRSRPVLIALAVAAAIALFALASSMMGVRTAKAEPVAQTVAPEPAAKTEQADVGVAYVPEGGVELWTSPDQDAYFTLAEGISLPFLHRADGWLLVTTMCSDTAWIQEDDVVVQEQGTVQPLGTTFDLSKATIVLDPGHGDRDWGGVGPTGLSEKSVNLDIADRARALMESSQSVDWDTGEVTTGSDIPSFGNVVLTRDLTGPNDGDFEVGLGFRATLATAAGADAFVSIHNNTVPRSSTDIPGSEVYYSVAAEGSDRLAGLIYEELLRSFSSFDADWSGGELLGARARLDPATGEDYYGLLRRATMPAVIVEGVYISEPQEEALLASEEFRQAYAEAVYRGVVRFLSTEDEGAQPNAPEDFPYDAGTVTGNGCALPAQP